MNFLKVATAAFVLALSANAASAAEAFDQTKECAKVAQEFRVAKTNSIYTQFHDSKAHYALQASMLLELWKTLGCGNVAELVQPAN